MRLVKLWLAASILIASGIGAAAVEMVRPYEALEQSRRARIESDKRQKREEAEQRKRDREEEAQQEAQRKRDAAAAKVAQGARPPSTSLPPQPSAAPALADEPRLSATRKPAGAAVADCDRLMEVMKQRRSTGGVTIKQVHALRAANDASACRAALARIDSTLVQTQPGHDGAQTAETEGPRRQPNISVAPPEQRGQANQPQPLAQNAAPARPQVNAKPADPQVSTQAPTAPPQATRQAAERQPLAQNAPPARPQVGPQPLTVPPPATGQADERRPQARSEPAESRVGVNQGQGEPQGRVQNESPPVAGASATPNNAAAAAPAASGHAIAVSRLHSMNLYNERGDELGDVERVMQSPDGNLHIVIGAGGFLGMRERDVRIPLERVTIRGDRLVIQGLTDDQVRIMPVFDRNDRTFRELEGNATVPLSATR